MHQNVNETGVLLCLDLFDLHGTYCLIVLRIQLLFRCTWFSHNAAQ